MHQDMVKGSVVQLKKKDIFKVLSLALTCAFLIILSSLILSISTYIPNSINDLISIESLIRALLLGSVLGVAMYIGYLILSKYVLKKDFNLYFVPFFVFTILLTYIFVLKDRIPLHCSIYRDEILVFNKLIERVNINQKDDNLNTPLHYAAALNSNMYEKLIQLGANQKAKNLKGYTAHDVRERVLKFCNKEKSDGCKKNLLF